MNKNTRESPLNFASIDQAKDYAWRFAMKVWARVDNEDGIFEVWPGGRTVHKPFLTPAWMIAAQKIDKLEAGSALDAMIADKVMEIPKAWIHHDPEGKDFNLPTGPMKIAPCEKYSTDIGAAWEVVEKLAPNFVDVEIVNRQNRLAVAKFIWGHGPQEFFVGNAETVPHAICRAALKAVLGESK